MVIEQPVGAAVLAARTLAARKRAVEAYLGQFLTSKTHDAALIAPDSRWLLENVRRFTLAGGKRVRAALVAAGYVCFAAEPDDDRLAAAGAAVELLHAFLLAHDDVFDRDVTRHGQPTLHHQFALDIAARYPEADAGRYGMAMAILAGDIAAMLAQEAIALVPVDPERRVRASLVLSRVALETGFGEALDVLAELDPEVDEERVLQIHRYKTAKYTIEGPLHIGAILAGGRPEQLVGLSAFAVPFGVAYQLQDDLLGVFGSEATTGKAVGADLREGKRTLLTVHGLRGPHAAALASLIGNRALDPAGVATAQRLLREGGSLAHTEQRRDALVWEATEALRRLEIREEGRAFLTGLLGILAGRVA